MPAKRCYLFALEIVPLEVDKAYDSLPLHCTLMHRFWGTLTPEELLASVKSVLTKYPEITFKIGDTTKLGPKDTLVYELHETVQLKALHMDLHRKLSELGTEFTENDWVGTGYTPHISVREGPRLTKQEQLTCKTLYLIEVKAPGYQHKRLIRERVRLG